MATDTQTLLRIVETLRGHPVNDQGQRIVCIDGPAGSGKTTLAHQIAQMLDSQIIHMDDLYGGWTGIETGALHLEQDILLPLKQGRAGSYRRFDWGINKYAERHKVPPADWLVVEGCASATRLVDKHGAFIIWVEAADETRLARGLARDGEHLRSQWERFMADEQLIYQRNNTRERAHLTLDGFGNIVAGTSRL